MANFEIDLICYDCNNSLEADQFGSDLHVRPCKHCTEEQYNLGFDQGSDQRD